MFKLAGTVTGVQTWGTVLVNVAIVAGMFLVVPLGLRLVDGTALFRRLWLVAAVPGAFSLFLPGGPVAAGLAVVYALMTFALAGLAVRRFFHRRSLSAREIAVLTALVSPAVAGSSLVAERARYPLMGFDLDVLTLTVAHFHYAGFAAALVAGLVCQAAPGGLGDLAAVTVPAGTVLVAIGHFAGEWVELAGALVLTAGMWLVAWITLRLVAPAATDRLVRIMFWVSAVVLSGTMLLAIEFAFGEATGFAHLSLDWMAATHGLFNAFGFALCAILAWRRLGSSIGQSR